MALGTIESTNSNTSEKINGSMTDLVIDLSALKIDGIQKDELQTKINAWAEKQMNQDHVVSQIKSILSAHGRDGVVDSVFDGELVNDFNGDKDELKTILSEYASELLTNKELWNKLKAGINLTLTEAGKNKIMNGQQSIAYYNQPTVTKPDGLSTPENCLPTATIRQDTSQGNVPAPGNPGCDAPVVPNKKIEKTPVVTEARNQLAAYRPQNIRCGPDASERSLPERDIVATKSNARTALRTWIRGTDDELNFVAEGDRVGDRIVNLATANDKAILKDSLYRPLKILCVNNKEGFLSGLRRKVSVDGLDEDKIWKQLMSTYNTSKGNLQSEQYRESVARSSSEFSLLGGKADNFAKWMVKLGTLYSDYRDKKYTGGYIEKLMSMLDNEFRVNNDGFEDKNVAKGYERIVNTHNNNNDAVKNLNLNGHKLLDKKSDSNKARKGLEEMGVNIDEATAYGQSLVETHNIKALVDNASFAKFDNASFAEFENNIPATTNEEGFMNFLADTSFSGGIDNSDVGTRQGDQLLSQFRIAVAQTAYQSTPRLDLNTTAGRKAAQDAVLRNIIAFVGKQAAYNTDPKYNNIFSELNTVIGKDGNIGQYLIGDKEHSGSAQDSFLSKNPGMLKFMQNTLFNHPGSMDGIMLYGNQGAEVKMQSLYKEASSAVLDSAMEGLNETQKVVFTEVYNNNKSDIQAYIKKYQETHTTNAMSEHQLLQSIALNTVHVLAQDISAYYLGGDVQKTVVGLTNEVKTPIKGGEPHKATVDGVSVDGSIGAGGSIALAKRVKLNYGLATDGATIVPALSVSANQDLGGGVQLGQTINVIVPGGGGALSKTFAGKDRTGKTLDTISMKSTTIAADASMNVIGASVGVGFYRERDILGGIDQGYEHRKTEGKELVSDLLKEVNVNSTSDSIKKSISDQMAVMYPNCDAATKQVMIDNLHAAMMSLGCGLKDNTIDKAVLIDQLAQTFAGEWKNQAVMGLKGTKLTGWGMRAGITTNPRANALNILTLGTSLKFTNFNRGLHYEETAESLSSLDQAEKLGKNTRLVSKSIGADEVAYMNNMFSTNQHRMMYKVSKIEFDASNNRMRIPQALWQGQGQVNVKIDPRLKGLVKMDQGFLVVPANVDMTVNAYPQGSGVAYVLSLGSSVVRPAALDLITGRDVPAGREADDMTKVTYEGEKPNPLTQERVEGLIKKLKDKNKAYDKFNVKVDSVDADKVKIDIDGQKFELPAQGGGKIVLENGKFTVTPMPGSSNSFSLSFENKTAGSTTPGTQPGPESIVFNEFNEIDTDLETNAVTELEKPANLAIIESLENANSAQFYYFLDKVMDRKSTEAAKHLLNMLDYKGPKNKLPALRAVLTSGTSEQKDAIISHMLSVFAIEEQSYKGKNIAQLIAHRDGTSKNLPPAYTRIGNNPLNFLTRNDFNSAGFDMKLKPGVNGTKETDLLGYTAFYRNPKRGTAHRGFALTTPGYTKTLGGSQDIPPSKVDQAKNWLKTQMKDDKFAKRAIGDVLRKKPGLSTITDDQAFQLTQLKAGETIKVGGNDVSLQSRPVFYFLAECANESIGLKIENITIQKPGEDPIVVPGDLNPATGSLDFNPGSTGRLFVNTTDTRGVAAISGATSFQAGGGIAGKVGKKEEEGFNDGLGAETSPGKNDKQTAEPPKPATTNTSLGKTDTQTNQAPSNSSAL